VHNPSLGPATMDVSAPLLLTGDYLANVVALRYMVLEVCCSNITGTQILCFIVLTCLTGVDVGYCKTLMAALNFGVLVHWIILAALILAFLLSELIDCC